jgi:hypothetical protein
MNNLHLFRIPTVTTAMIEDPVNAASSDVPPPKPVSAAKKRKRTATATPAKGKGKLVDHTFGDEAEVQSPSSKKKNRASPKKHKDEEKRLRRFRQHAPGSYLEKLQRATTQR